MNTQTINLPVSGYQNFKRFNNIFCEVVEATPYNLHVFKPDVKLNLVNDGFVYDKAIVHNVIPCIFEKIPKTVVEVATGFTYANARKNLAEQFNCSNEKIDTLYVLLLVIKKLL